MSIKADVLELESIRSEIKSLNIRRKTLLEKEKIVQQRIQDFLLSKDQLGVKYGNTAIIIEKKETRKTKKAKEKVVDGAMILERYGINNPEKVLSELLDSQKGEVVVKEKLKMKKFKK